MAVPRGQFHTCGGTRRRPQATPGAGSPSQPARSLLQCFLPARAPQGAYLRASCMMRRCLLHDHGPGPRPPTMPPVAGSARSCTAGADTTRHCRPILGKKRWWTNCSVASRACDCHASLHGTELSPRFESRTPGSSVSAAARRHFSVLLSGPAAAEKHAPMPVAAKSWDVLRIAHLAPGNWRETAWDMLCRSSVRYLPRAARSTKAPTPAEDFEAVLRMGRVAVTRKHVG
eukprot:5439114-Prymnesium_polylepis.1